VIALIAAGARRSTGLLLTTAGVIGVVGAIVRTAGPRRVGTTVLIVAALVAFFGLWNGLITSGSSLVGVLLFVGSIATFRLMNWFERPPRP
jgi:hypothetical protein